MSPIDVVPREVIHAVKVFADANERWRAQSAADTTTKEFGR